MSRGRNAISLLHLYTRPRDLIIVKNGSKVKSSLPQLFSLTNKHLYQTMEAVEDIVHIYKGERHTPEDKAIGAILSSTLPRSTRLFCNCLKNKAQLSLCYLEGM